MENTDWMENHELRIFSLEKWKDDHEAYTRGIIAGTARTELSVDQIKEGMVRQDKHLERQDDKLDNLAAQMNKVIIGALTTIVLMLLKLVLDIFIPHIGH